MPENENTPPWGEDDANCDPQKAWALIKNLRSENRAQKSELDAAKQEAESVKQERDQLTAANEELQATIQLTDDTVKTHESTISGLNGTISKQSLLSDNGIPLKYLSLVSGDTEDEWKSSVDNLIELRGQQTQERRPDPAQAAEPVVDEKESLAAQFFGK